MPKELGVRVFDVIHEILTRGRNSVLAERRRVGEASADEMTE